MPDTAPGIPNEAGRIYDPKDASRHTYQQKLVLAGGLLVTICVARLFLPLGIRTTTIAIWIGIGLSLGAVPIIEWWASSRRFRSLRDLLRQRCESLYGVDLSDATYVGLPSGSYQTDYDRGFLMIEPGMMCYLGERKSLCLRPEQVIRVDVLRKGGGLPTGIRITWRQTKVSAWKLFTVVARDSDSAKELQAQTDSLASWIEEWSHGPAPESELTLPQPVAPHIDEQPRVGPNCSCSWLLVGIPVFAVCFAIVYGLSMLLYGRDPFEWLSLGIVSYLAIYMATDGLTELILARIGRRGAHPGERWSGHG